MVALPPDGRYPHIILLTAESYPKRPTRAQGVPSMKEIEKVMAKNTFSSEM
jgi:hypothetical protein